MKRVLNTLITVGVVLVAILFATLNDTRVALDLFFIQTGDRPLAAWLILTFLVGLGLGGALVYVNMWIGLRRRIRDHRRELSQTAAGAGLSDSPENDKESPAAIARD